MAEVRIRLDLKNGGRVSITKTAIVAAVRLLEQDPAVNLNSSSQEVANWVVSHIKATHSLNDKGLHHVVGKITWVEDPKRNIFGNTENTGCSRFAIITDGKVVVNATEVSSRGLDMVEALPRILAKVIKDTPSVTKVETDIDDFI